MQDRKRFYQKGASLIEILIVLAVAMVLSTVAIVQVGNSKRNLDRQNLAREFKVNLERARFDSIKRRASVCSDMSRVTINDATSFSATTDLNQNGTLETAERQTINFGTRSNVTIIGNGVTLPITIRFDERGNAVLTDCVTTPPPNVPLLYFCNGTCTTGTANSQNSNVIFISPTGTVAMLAGGQTMPTFANPNVTNINSNTQINPQVNPELAVWEPATPTASATSTFTATATNTPTPVPSATPYICPQGPPWVYPAQVGCICTAPQSVRPNGQCK